MYNYFLSIAIISLGFDIVKSVSYEDQRTWGGRCNSNTSYQQSPINLASSVIVPTLPGIEFVGYNLPLQSLTLNNNGDSIAMTVATGASRPFLASVPYANEEDEYMFDSIEYHWGQNNSIGSEHQINSTSYPLEMHLIHYNRKYGNVSEAMNRPDGIVILAALFEASDSPILNTHATSRLSRSLSQIRNISSLELKNPLLDLDDFLGNLDVEEFYTYDGSLTRQPCSEAKWIVFGNTLKISSEVLDESFRKVLNENGMAIARNNRDVQTRQFGKNVYYRRQTDEEFVGGILQGILGLLESFGFGRNLKH